MDSNKCFQIGDLVRWHNPPATATEDIFRVTRIVCHPWFENGYRGDTAWFEGAISKTHDRIEAENVNPKAITVRIEAHEHYFQRAESVQS